MPRSTPQHDTPHDIERETVVARGEGRQPWRVAICGDGGFLLGEDGRVRHGYTTTLLVYASDARYDETAWTGEFWLAAEEEVRGLVADAARLLRSVPSIGEREPVTVVRL